MSNKNIRNIIVFGITALSVIIGGTFATYNQLTIGQTEISSFSKAKRVSAQVHSTLPQETFYCGCAYSITNKSTGSGKTDLASCGYDPRSNRTRANRIEWEHVFPAARIGENLACWNEGNELCDKPGRECCEKVNEAFEYAASDLNNLVPAIGEVNGDRGKLPFGEIPGEKRDYGQCDFEIDRVKDIVEPKEDIRGNIARIYLYMSDTYSLPLTENEIKMFEEWNREDRPDQNELERNTRIRNFQGLGNQYVTSPY